MEATVKMGSSLPVKAAVSQRQAPGKASGSKGDFTKLLQEKRDLAQNPEEEKAITENPEENRLDKPQKKDEGPKAPEEGTDLSEKAGQEALQQAALMQMAAQIVEAMPQQQGGAALLEAVDVAAVVPEEAAASAGQVPQGLLAREGDGGFQAKREEMPLRPGTVTDGEKVFDKPEKEVALEPVRIQAQTHPEEGKGPEGRPKAPEGQIPAAGHEAKKAQDVYGQEAAGHGTVQEADGFRATSQREAGHTTGHKTNPIPLKTTPENLPRDLGKALAAKLSPDNRTLTVELEPASLGKLTIRLVYEGQRAAVSILASNPKTLELLSQRAAEIADILKEKTGQETLIYTQQPEEGSRQYDEGRGSQSQGGQESREEGQRHPARETGNLESFAQQLRLGLV